MSRPTRTPAASASVPIPGSTQPSSGVESVLASFGDRFRVAARSPYGTSDAIYPSSSPSAAVHPSYGGVGFAPSTSGPTPASRSLSSQYQPRVTRAPTVDIHVANPSVSTSPVRNRRSSAHFPRPPPVASRTPTTQPTRRPSTSNVFTLPPYLTNSVLIGRMVGHVPEPESETPSRSSAAPVPRRAPSPARSSDSEDDGLSYPHTRRYQPQVVRSASPGPLSLNGPLQLPTQWNDEDKSRHLSISATGKDVTFNGPSSVSDRDAAAVRATCPIPPACGVYYYEVEIINRGIKGQISVGFAVKDLHLHRLPGWEVGSWGYHGDDGMSFAGQPRSGSPFGPKFTTGDVIGCGVNFVERNAFYTKNGRFLGNVFKDLPGHGLYPAIGLRTTHEQVRTNFGDTPFKFDIETYVADVRLKTWRDIQLLTWIQVREDTEKRVHDVKVRSPPSSVLPTADNISGELDLVRQQHENIGNLMASVICNYLAHEGYVNTATVLQQQLARRREKESAASGISTPKQQSNSELLAPATGTASTRPVNGDMEVDFDLTTDEDEVSNTVAPRSLHEFLTSHPSIPSMPIPTTPAEDTRYRRRIMGHILNGEIEEALKSLKEKYPKALLAEDGLVQFRLRCRRFAEMVLSTAEQLKAIRAAPESRYPYHHLAREETTGDVATEGANSMDLDEEEPPALISPTSVRFGRPLAPPGTGTVNGGSNNSSLAAGISNFSVLRAAAKGNPARRPSSSPRSPVRTRRSSHGSNHAHQQGLLTSLPPPTTSLAAQRQSEELLSRVWNFGQQLQTEFGSDPRPEVQDLLKRTVGIVAYQDPANNPQTRELVGFEARVALAEDVNRAILISQGRSPVATLERLYKQASTAVQVLGLAGVPLAAFADVDKELVNI